MCRRIACTGSPVLVEDLLSPPEEDASIVPGLHARSGGLVFAHVRASATAGYRPDPR